MIRYRKAALCLYGLRREDRNWLLERLPDAQRAELRRLLQELEQMNVPRDPTWVDMLQGDSQQNDTGCGHDGAIMPDYIDEIERAPLSEVKQVLSAEPIAIVAWVLGYRDWSWREAFLASCDAAQRHRVEPATGNHTLTPKVAETILKSLAHRLHGMKGMVQHRSAARP